MTIHPVQHPPLLRPGEPIEALVVPVAADGSFERGVSLAAKYAMAWGVSLHLVHVDDGGAADLDAAAARFRAAHPDVEATSSVVSADSVAAGVAAACGPRSLALIATDHAAERAGMPSLGEQIASAVDDVSLVLGPECVDPVFDGSIVVPLDGSERAEAALAPAVAFAEAHDARLWLLTVVPPTTVEHVDHLRSTGEEASESAYIRSVADRLVADGVAVRWEVVQGSDVTSSLVRFVNSNRVTAVVAASHGDSGHRRQLYGSVCMGLVERGQAPLLLVASNAVPIELPSGESGE